jgi:hypothetical protein
MLAEVTLQPWLTEPSPAAAAALVLPLFGALVVLGTVPALVSLWSRSVVAAGYRDAQLVDGTVVDGRSLAVAVAVAAGWAAALALAGWWRMRRNGIPIR